MSTRRRIVTALLLVGWIIMVLVVRELLAESPHRQWFAFAVPAILVVVFSVLGVVVWLRRQRELQSATLDRRAQLSARRRTIVVTWSACVGAVSSIPLVAVGATETTDSRSCGPSDVDPTRELCIVERSLEFEPVALAGLVGALLSSVLLGVWALGRWKATVLEVPHPDPEWDERPWHRRYAAHHRVMIVASFFTVIIAGSDLRSSTTSRFDGATTTCSTTERGDRTVEVCSSRAIEVERIVESGTGLAIGLIVIGVLATLAAVAWWVTAAILDRRRRIDRGFTTAFRIESQDPGFD